MISFSKLTKTMIFDQIVTKVEFEMKSLRESSGYKQQLMSLFWL